MHVACRFSSLHYVALENAHTPQLVKFVQANKKTSLLKALWGLVGKGVVNCALSAEDFLRGICQVKEAILVPLLGIEVAKGGRHWGHDVLVDEQEERLAWMQLHASPDYLHQFGHRDMVRHQKLCFVENGQQLFTRVALYDDGNFGRVLPAYCVDILLALNEIAPLLEHPQSLCTVSTFHKTTHVSVQNPQQPI